MNSPIRVRSLRQRLILAVLAATGLVFLVLGFAIHSAIERSSAIEFDERLAQQGRILLAYAGHEYLETGTVVPEAPVPANEYQVSDVVYQVWTRDGVPVHRSRGAPVAPLVSLTQRGFSDVRLGDAAWRTYCIQAVDQPLVVQMAELQAHRGIILARVLAAVRAPLLSALPLLALLVWWLTTKALRPVDRLAGHIRMRPAGDMSPLDISQMPEEVTALGIALNALILRQVEALLREQRFTADAAHELRTPLAAVRAQAQVALRSTTAADREHALRQLIAGVDRSTRLVTQLLSLARLDPAAGDSGMRVRSVARVLDDVIHDLEIDAERHNVRMEITVPPIEMPVADEPLYLLLRNIIDNAIRHSPGGATIAVDIRRSDSHLIIAIADQGPGIPKDQREAVFDRFRRLSDTYAGSGLGLSIVRQVVDLLRGEIELLDASPPPGLLVRVRLPIPAGGP